MKVSKVFLHKHTTVAGITALEGKKTFLEIGMPTPDGGRVLRMVARPDLGGIAIYKGDSKGNPSNDFGSVSNQNLGATRIHADYALLPFSGVASFTVEEPKGGK